MGKTDGQTPSISNNGNEERRRVTLNVLVVSVIGRFSVTRHHTSVYNVLFVNLAVTNALTSILLWFANNLLTRSTFLCTI